jgi:hypothetical protein
MVPAETSQSVPAPLPADKSWWENIMYKLGFGADPNPGETVQSAASGCGLHNWSG